LNTSDAVEILKKQCDAYGFEVSITDERTTIYWENLRVDVNGKNIDVVIKAIKTLFNNDAYFE